MFVDLELFEHTLEKTQQIIDLPKLHKSSFLRENTNLLIAENNFSFFEKNIKNPTFASTYVDCCGTHVYSFIKNYSGEIICGTPHDCSILSPHVSENNITLSVSIKFGDGFMFYFFSTKRSFFENVNSDWKTYPTLFFNGKDFSYSDNKLQQCGKLTTSALLELFPDLTNIPQIKN